MSLTQLHLISKEFDRISNSAKSSLFLTSFLFAWGEANNTDNKIIMLSDPYLLLTKAIGAEVDRNSKGMGIRSNRYAMVIENLEVINIQIEKETKQYGLSSAESILDTL